jgi:hypothetical protein
MPSHSIAFYMLLVTGVIFFFVDRFVGLSAKAINQQSLSRQAPIVRTKGFQAYFLFSFAVKIVMILQIFWLIAILIAD